MATTKEFILVYNVSLIYTYCCNRRSAVTREIEGTKVKKGNIHLTRPSSAARIAQAYRIPSSVERDIRGRDTIEELDSKSGPQ